MSITDKHIIEVYSGLLEKLSSEVKTELIQKLSKSLSMEEKNEEYRFFKSFGAFVSEKSVEEIIEEIRSNRNFREKDINF